LALLADGRADPAADESATLRYAAYSGHVGVIVALLLDGRADPSARLSEALSMAAGRGHLDIVQAFVADGRGVLAPGALCPAALEGIRPNIARVQRWQRRRTWLRAGAL
jgi:hypothetical protein